MSEHDHSNPPGHGKPRNEARDLAHGPPLPHDAPKEMPPLPVHKPRILTVAAWDIMLWKTRNFPYLPRPPFFLTAAALIAITATWLPLVFIARARTLRSDQPRIQIMQDMGSQPRYSAQQTNPVFADEREMRPAIPGTVARGDVEEDDHYYRGFTSTMAPAATQPTITFYPDLPSQLAGTPDQLHKLVERGQLRFNIYCYVCHGLDGSGHGPVNERAIADQLAAGNNGDPKLAGMTWTQAAQLTSPTVRAEPDGKIFNTITNGYRTMPSYAGQIPVEDRWAIVAYVRALQLSAAAPRAIFASNNAAVQQPAESPATIIPATEPATRP